jgi:tRNA A37 threonylcarbamoyltransferase TsaD
LTTHPDVAVYFPHRSLATDNSLMIALAGFAHADRALAPAAAADLVRAHGNRPLTTAE